METFLFFALLLITSAIFSGTETAFTSLNELKLQRQKSKTGRLLREMVKNKRNVIAAILVGNNIVNTVLAVYAGAFFDEMLVSSGLLTEKMGPLFASIITIIFLLIFGEVVPKHLGVTFTSLWMKTVSYPLWLIVRILKPVTSFMELFSRLLIKCLPQTEEDDKSPDINELLIMARYSAKAGHIDEIERKLVARATRFNDLEARDVMIPRQQVVGVPDNISLEELKQKFEEHKLSRMPVFIGEIDHVAGIFNFKELLTLSHQQQSNSKFNILNHCHKPLFIPESVPIGQLFDQMKQKKNHMAVVVDEFGGTAGIVTLEDIIERIFGLIHDEYDEESVQTIEQIAKNEYLVRGRTSLEDLENNLGLNLPENLTDKVNTVNGLLTYIKGDFPQKRDSFLLDSLEFRVEEAKNMRATRVRVILKKTAGEE